MDNPHKTPLQHAAMVSHLPIYGMKPLLEVLLLMAAVTVIPVFDHQEGRNFRPPRARRRLKV